MLQNEWTARTVWTAHGVKNIRTEFLMPPTRGAAKMFALLIYQHLYAINRRAISPCPLMT